jgi:broad specificity phosphatase PhoE
MIERASLNTTHLFLVRHGETEFNRQQKVQGRGIDAPLNALGRAQAEALALRAASLGLDAIYASTLLRARETAGIVGRACPDIPLFFLNDLEEMSWGIYEGRAATPDLKSAFDTMRAEWLNGNYDYRAEKGESVTEVQERGKRAINHILETHSGKRVMVVAHGRFLRILLATLLDEFGLKRMEEIKHANTGLNHLVCSSDAIEARLLNCTLHLEDQSM